MDLCSFEIYSGNVVGNELNECQDLHVEITTRVRIFLLRGRDTRVLETTFVAIPMKVKSSLRHCRDHPLLVHVKLYMSFLSFLTLSSDVNIIRLFSIRSLVYK